MFIATLIFWLGRQAVRARAADTRRDPIRSSNVARTALFARRGDREAGVAGGPCRHGAVLVMLCFAIGPSFWPEKLIS